MSGERQEQMRWSLSLLLSNPACGVLCLLLAVGVGVAFGIKESMRDHNPRTAKGDLSVFSAESPSLPSSILLHP